MHDVHRDLANAKGMAGRARVTPTGATAGKGAPTQPPPAKPTDDSFQKPLPEEEGLGAEGVRLLEEAYEELRTGQRFFTSEEIKQEFDL